VVDTLVVIYLTGWSLVTFIAYAAGRRFGDKRTPAPHPFAVSVVAGAVWPLLVVGLVEMSSIVVYAKVSRPRRSVGIFA
jgi:hypothetical protein